jgi:hypothetical protein
MLIQTSAPRGEVLVACASVVGFRNRAGDCEAEAGAIACARGVGAGEPLEGLLEERWWESRALIADVQFDVAVRPLRGEADGAAAVAEGVVNEVREGLFESNPVAVDAYARCGVGLDWSARFVYAPLEAAADCREEVVDRKVVELQW